jgi:hypothetical protein
VAGAAVQTPDDSGSIMCGSDFDGDGTTEARCREIGPGENLSANTTTRNLGAFARTPGRCCPT